MCPDWKPSKEVKGTGGRRPVAPVHLVMYYCVYCNMDIHLADHTTIAARLKPVTQETYLADPAKPGAAL